MSTYLAMYITQLEERIAAGGTQADVEAAVAQYNVFDQKAFDAWLEGVAQVSCVSCGAPFKPSSKIASIEILCGECGPR